MSVVRDISARPQDEAKVNLAFAKRICLRRSSRCPLSANNRHLDEHRHFRRRVRARRSNICDQAEGLALFRDRAIVANFIFMGDTVRSGLGTCGEAAIMKRKVYANVG
jgi:hypothetical protein